MVLITIVTGAYKPTYNWGASHCIENGPLTDDFPAINLLFQMALPVRYVR